MTKKSETETLYNVIRRNGRRKQLVRMNVPESQIVGVREQERKAIPFGSSVWISVESAY